MAGAADAMGANLLQRTAKRRGHRNGIHMRLLASPASDIQRRIPSFRTSSVTLFWCLATWLRAPCGMKLWKPKTLAYLPEKWASGRGIRTGIG